MPEQNPQITNYFQARIDTFLLHLKNTISFYDVESLHQLRVEIKKLRAYLNLFAYAGMQQSSEKDYRKQLSTVFKPGGKLRETQINRMILEAHPDAGLPVYAESLLQREAKQLSRFKTVFETSVHPEELQKNNVEFLENTGQFSLEQFDLLSSDFLKQSFDEIRSLMPEMHDVKKLHEIRRHLKVIGYVFQALFELKADLTLEPFYLELKLIETLIGNWHDQVVFISHIEKFLKKNPEFPEKDKLSLFKNKLIGECELMIDEIERQLKLLFTFDYFA